MAQFLYDKIMGLYSHLVEQQNVSIAELHRMVEEFESDQEISVEWMHSVYKKRITDPGLQKMDALHRVLKTKNQQLRNKSNT